MIFSSNNLPQGWIRTKIGELFDFIGGGTPSKNDIRLWNGGVPWASVKDIKGDYLTETQDKITQLGVQNSSTNIAEPGEVILITRISPGKVITSKIRTAVNQDLKIVRPWYNANPDFIRYLFAAIEKECVRLSSGTTVLGLSLDKLNDINVFLPPLNEQNRIVAKLDELLSELEKGKEQLQTALEQLKVYRQSILKQAFEGKLTEEWRREQQNLKTADELVDDINIYRQQEYEKQLKAYKEGKTKQRPKEPKTISILEESYNNSSQWALVKLGEVAETTSGGTPSRNNPSYYLGKIPWVKSGELKYNIIYDTEEKITEDAIESSSAKIFPRGTLLIAIYGATVGRLAFLGVEAATNQAVCGIFQKPYYSLKFLYYFLMFKRPELVNQSTGGAQPNISQTILNNLPIPLCSMEEQQSVVETIESIFSLNDELENSLIQNLSRSDSLKQSLLQQAFEGKLVEQDPNDESATVLLEQIKKERETFLEAEKLRKRQEKASQTKTPKMAAVLKQILDILKESSAPVPAKTLWLSSVHKDSIDDFYTELKKHLDAGEIEELPRHGKESLVKLAETYEN